MIETEEVEYAEPLPFLRLTGTYPSDGDRATTVQLEMYLPDDQPLAEHDGGDAATRSWFTDFTTSVIQEMRRGSMPPDAKVDVEFLDLDKMRSEQPGAPAEGAV